MRVVIPIINISWHGGTRVLLQLANYLTSKGHDVDIFVSRRRADSPFHIDSKVRIRHLGIRTRFKYLDYAVFLLLLPWRTPRHAVFVATFFVTYFPIRLAAGLRRRSYAYVVQDVESKYSGMLGRVLNFFCNASYRDPRIIAVNTYLARRLAESFSPPSLTVNIGPGDAFYKPRREAGPDVDAVYLARREPWKRLDRFREIVAMAGTSMRFLCISQDKALLDEMSKLGLACESPANDDELVDQMDRARALLLTSDREGFALPPLEAMARGVVPVIFPCGGPSVYLEDGVNGLVVESSSEALANLIRLRDDAAHRDRLVDACTRTASHFMIEQALQSITNYLITLDNDSFRAEAEGK